ncbi:hypothetical protein ACOJQI_21550 [Bacillus salacetis]|uniref:hypothetical protein n=1 Tax=Bacillus salacetis TaxID=2315464 RepID=UPI003B9DFEE6
MNQDPLNDLKAELDKEIFSKHEFRSRKDTIVKKAIESNKENPPRKHPAWVPLSATAAALLIAALLTGNYFLAKNEETPLQADELEEKNDIDNDNMIEDLPNIEKVPDEVKENETEKDEKIDEEDVTIEQVVPENEPPEISHAEEIRQKYAGIWAAEKLDIKNIYLGLNFQDHEKSFQTSSHLSYKNNIPTLHQIGGENNNLEIFMKDKVVYYSEYKIISDKKEINDPVSYLKDSTQREIYAYPYYPAKISSPIASEEYSWKIIEENSDSIEVSGTADRMDNEIVEFNALIHSDTGIILNFSGYNNNGEKVLGWETDRFELNPVWENDLSDRIGSIIEWSTHEKGKEPIIFREEWLNSAKEEIEKGESVEEIYLGGSDNPTTAIVIIGLAKEISKQEEKELARKILEHMTEEADKNISGNRHIWDENYFRLLFTKPPNRIYYMAAYNKKDAPQDKQGIPEISWQENK